MFNGEEQPRGITRKRKYLTRPIIHIPCAVFSRESTRREMGKITLLCIFNSYMTISRLRRSAILCGKYTENTREWRTNLTVRESNMSEGSHLRKKPTYIGHQMTFLFASRGRLALAKRMVICFALYFFFF